jgi:hypothetical protein
LVPGAAVTVRWPSRRFTQRAVPARIADQRDGAADRVYQEKCPPGQRMIVEIANANAVTARVAIVASAA